MIKYPKELNAIFNKLQILNIRPIIVGGFVRDSLLGIPSKDIDIELYGISSFETLEKILKEFGSVNSVGKSFGVCKLTLDTLDLDFSLPRLDSKIESGHRGFKIQTNSNLNFTTASKRRDFTINAIGYDVSKKKILDPYKGIKDLERKILNVVDRDTFIEDPLRVLRAVQFSARFELTISEELFKLCRDMIKNSCLNELPKERIFSEIEKLLLKASKVSLGFNLLKELGALEYFRELKSLNDSEWKQTLVALDEMVKYRSDDDKENIALMISVLTYRLKSEIAASLLAKISDEKELSQRVLALTQAKLCEKPTNYELYTLSNNVNIEELLTLRLALKPQNIKIYKDIKKRAKELNILNAPFLPLLQGRDLIGLGLKASPDFKSILHRSYEAQKNERFAKHKEGIIWLKEELRLKP